MTNELYMEILARHLRGTTPAVREYDDYGPVPTDAEFDAMNRAFSEYLARTGNRVRVVSSIFDDPIFDGPEFADVRRAYGNHAEHYRSTEEQAFSIGAEDTE